MRTLIGSDAGTYSFNPTAKTITLSGVPTLRLENWLLVTNVTRGVSLYNFSDPALSGVCVGNVLTLAVDTSAMSAGDALQIWVDIPAEVGQENVPLPVAYVQDVQLAEIFGSTPLIDNDGYLRAVNRAGISNTVVKNVDSNNATVQISCAGYSQVVLQIVGTWGGVFTFQGSANSSDYINAAALPLAGTPPVAMSTANGIWTIPCVGLKAVRVVFTWTSGTANVMMVAANGNAIQVSPTSQVVADSQLPTLFTPALTDLPLQKTAPVIAPNQPTSYAGNKYANYPQTFRRIRVEAAGITGLPFSQSPRGTLEISAPEIYSLLERSLLVQIRTAELLADGFSKPMPELPY